MTNHFETEINQIRTGQTNKVRTTISDHRIKERSFILWNKRTFIYSVKRLWSNRTVTSSVVYNERSVSKIDECHCLPRAILNTIHPMYRCLPHGVGRSLIGRRARQYRDDVAPRRALSHAPDSGQPRARRRPRPSRALDKRR